MADPQIRLKRSSVALKRPSLGILTTGEFAINTYDGSLFTVRDTGGVGIATTVTNLTPWTENIGAESITYSGIQTSGGGTTTDYSSVTLSGLTPTGFNTTYTRQSTGFVLDTGTVASGNALFDTDSSYYYYVDSDNTNRMLIYSESDNNWMGVATTEAAASTDYNVLTTSGLSPSSFNQTYTRQATGFILDTGTVASGNAIFRTDSSHYYYVASTGSDAEDRIVIWSEEDNAWLTVFDFNDPDFREGNISNGQALGSSFIFNATLATGSDTFNGRNVPDADDANVTYDTTKDYTSLTLDASISDLDGDYTRQSFKANLDTGTVSSGNALFNATSDYWWFLKDGDNSKMIIYDSVAGYWTYVGKTGGDFSSAANNTAVGSVNTVESQTLSSVAYESSAYQPDANYSEITYGSLSGTDFTSASNNDSVTSSVLANEQLVLSGMSDSNHNGTYDMVYRDGNRMLATVEQSGASVIISIEREAEYYLGISGTGISAIDNGGNLTVQKYTGYIYNSSGDTWTWITGSTGGIFHWYYWDTTDDIFVAYDATNSEWKAFDLGEATGNVASFISDLDSTGSQGGYISSGENFTLTSANIASLTSDKDIYPGTSIIRVPDGDDSNITYGSASDHPYYVYQTADAKKWVLFALESSYYWTAYYRSTAFDLRTETLTDDATAFTLDSTSDFEYITANSDTYNGNNIPDADDSNVSYSAASSVGITTVIVTSGKTTADSRFVPTASGSIVYGTTAVGVTTSAVGVVTFNTDGDLILAGTVDGRDVATDGSNQDNLQLLTGVSAGATTLGTFTGTTISDNEDIKTALQDLETAVDNVVGGNSGAASVLVSSTSTDASFFPTFVADNNNSGTQETFSTDAGITYNPSSNILTVSGSVAANVTGNLTGDVTGTATTATNLADAANITTGTISNDRLPSTITKNLTGDVTGNVTGNATSADTVDVTDASSTNDTFNPVFSDGSGSGETIMMDVGLIYNPSSNTLTAGTFSGSLSGTADVADNVDVVNVSTTNLDLTLTMSDGSNTTTGRTLGMDSDLTYNPSTNTLTAGTVVGNLTGDVTGTATTATNAVQLQTSRNIGGVAFNGTADINLPGVNAAGNQNTSGTAGGLSGSPSITVTDITAVGNVSIAGTLTYEDVTSVDAIGIVTARTGVRVTTGGIVVSAGGLDVTGVTTFRSHVRLGDDDELRFGANDDFKIVHDPNDCRFENSNGDIKFKNTGSYFFFDEDGGETLASFINDGAINLFHSGSKKFCTTSTGAIVTGVLTATSFVGDVTGNVSGNAGTATSLATTRTIHGVSFDGTSDIDLSEVIQDTVGTMFSGNTETGITVTYEDGDGTIDLVVGTLNQDTTGTAALAEGLTGTPNIIVGVVTASTLDISGDVDIDGTLEADAITIDGISLSETIADTVGGMVSSNTETGITVTYDDSDNTLDFVIGTLNQDTTGNAGTATSLATARTIAGVSFDGTSDISLNNNAITNGAGYITTSFTNTNQLTNGAGFITTSFTNTNQLTNGAGFITASDDITGNADTATALETARNIGGVAFNGTADINLPGVNATGNQNTSGTAAGLSGSPSITVTDITAVGNVSIAGTLTYEDVTSVDALGIVTARTGVRISTGGLVVSAGGANITGGITGDLTGDVTGNVSGNAGTATSLATARTIAGVSFDGTSDISLNNNAITNGAGYITTSFTSYNQLSDKPTIPTNNNQLTNGAGYITTSFTNTNQLTNGAGFITNNVSGVLTATQFKGDGSTLSNIPTSIVAGDNISVSGATGAVTITGLANTSNVRTDTLNVIGVSTFSGNLNLGDDVCINVGDSSDLKIYHDGDHSYVSDEGQGNLKFRSNAFKFTNVAESKTGLVVNPPTAVEAYFNGSKKLETTNDGVNIVGTCTATSFVGDGSGLTNIGVSTSNVRSDTVQVGVLTATSQFYPPSLTTTERDAITFNTGAFIFNSTEQRLQVYLGSTWASLTVDIDPYSIINM